MTSTTETANMSSCIDVSSSTDFGALLIRKHFNIDDSVRLEVPRYYWKGRLVLFSEYRVSTDGEVFSLKGAGGKPRKLKLSPDNRGYVGVQLRKDRAITITVPTHQAVAYTYIGHGSEGQEVRHLDGDRLNNRLNNLVYGSKRENAHDKRLHGTMSFGERSGSSKISFETAQNICNDYAAGEKVMDICRKYQLRHGTVGYILSGATWTEVERVIVPPTKSKTLTVIQKVTELYETSSSPLSAIGASIGLSSVTASRLYNRGLTLRKLGMV